MPRRCPWVDFVPEGHRDGGKSYAGVSDQEATIDVVSSARDLDEPGESGESTRDEKGRDDDVARVIPDARAAEGLAPPRESQNK